MIFDLIFVQSSQISNFDFENFMIIDFNNNLCEFIDVSRKLIMSNKHVMHYHVKSENQNKRVFFKTRYSFFDILDIFQNFNTLSSVYKKSNVVKLELNNHFDLNVLEN